MVLKTRDPSAETGFGTVCVPSRRNAADVLAL